MREFGNDGYKNPKWKFKIIIGLHYDLQLFELERKFYHKKYLASSERKKLAQLLNLTDIQVRNLILPLWYLIDDLHRLSRINTTIIE